MDSSSLEAESLRCNLGCQLAPSSCEVCFALGTHDFDFTLESSKGCGISSDETVFVSN